MNISDDAFVKRFGLEIIRANMADIVISDDQLEGTSDTDLHVTQPSATYTYSNSVIDHGDETEKFASCNINSLTSQPPAGILGDEYIQPIFDSLSLDLTYLKKNDAIAFRDGPKTMFSSSEYDLGRTSLLTYHINTESAHLIRQSMRRHPQTYLKVID